VQMAVNKIKTKNSKIH